MAVKCPEPVPWPIASNHVILLAQPIRRQVVARTEEAQALRRPDGARTIAKRELYQLRHRLQKLPSAARAIDKPT